MGEVVTEFMPRRAAQRYVEVLRSKGKQEADMWWKTFKWFPSDEEFAQFQKEVTKLTVR